MEAAFGGCVLGSMAGWVLGWLTTMIFTEKKRAEHALAASVHEEKIKELSQALANFQKTIIHQNNMLGQIDQILHPTPPKETQA